VSTIHLHETTTVTPEQFVAGLTGARPFEALPNSADEYLEVHDQGADHADVTLLTSTGES